MMRTFQALVPAMLALALSTPATAASADRETLKEARQEMRDARQDRRQIDRMAHRWDKAVEGERERRLARLDGRLDDFADEELAELEARGVPLLPLLAHPQHADVMLEPRPGLAPLRDDLLALRELTDQVVRRGGDARAAARSRRALDRISERLGNQELRREARVERLKS